MSTSTLAFIEINYALVALDVTIDPERGSVSWKTSDKTTVVVHDDAIWERCNSSKLHASSGASEALANAFPGAEGLTIDYLFSKLHEVNSRVYHLTDAELDAIEDNQELMTATYDYIRSENVNCGYSRDDVADWTVEFIANHMLDMRTKAA